MKQFKIGALIALQYVIAILVAPVVIWKVANLCKKMILGSGATMITFGDIVTCWASSILIIGALAFLLVCYLSSVIRQIEGTK